MATTARKRHNLVGALIHIIFVVAILAGVSYFAYTGYKRSADMRDLVEGVNEAHQAGNSKLVVRLYEADGESVIDKHRRFYVLLPRAQTRELHRTMHLKIGNSYSLLGDDLEANRHYLKVVGWSESRYEAWCHLSTNCPSPEELAKRKSP